MRHSLDVADRIRPSHADIFSRSETDRVDAPPLVPTEQVIDREHLGRMTLGDVELEREVLQLLDQQAGMLLDRMTREAPRVVAALAHTLVGSARGVGAWKLASAAETVERLAGKPGPTTLTAAMNRLSAAVTETQAAIGTMICPH
jgi:HPt (histidine-containing phosphotransfer) domain-containing protein